MKIRSDLFKLRKSGETIAIEKHKPYNTYIYIYIYVCNDFSVNSRSKYYTI